MAQICRAVKELQLAQICLSLLAQICRAVKERWRICAHQYCYNITNPNLYNLKAITLAQIR